MTTYQDEHGNIHHKEDDGQATIAVPTVSLTRAQAALLATLVAVGGGILGIAASGTKLTEVTASITERSRLADDVRMHCSLAEASSKAIESLLSKTGSAKLPDVDAKAFVRCARTK